MDGISSHGLYRDMVSRNGFCDSEDRGRSSCTCELKKKEGRIFLYICMYIIFLTSRALSGLHTFPLTLLGFVFSLSFSFFKKKNYLLSQLDTGGNRGACRCRC